MVSVYTNQAVGCYCVLAEAYERYKKLTLVSTDELFKSCPLKQSPLTIKLAEKGSGKMNEEENFTEEDVRCGKMSLENLKNEINLFLFKWLPDKTTILQVELMACKIHTMITALHEPDDGKEEE